MRPQALVAKLAARVKRTQPRLAQHLVCRKLPDRMPGDRRGWGLDGGNGGWSRDHSLDRSSGADGRHACVGLLDRRIDKCTGVAVGNVLGKELGEFRDRDVGEAVPELAELFAKALQLGTGGGSLAESELGHFVHVLQHEATELAGFHVVVLKGALRVSAVRGKALGDVGNDDVTRRNHAQQLQRRLPARRSLLLQSLEASHLELFGMGVFGAVLRFKAFVKGLLGAADGVGLDGGYQLGIVAVQHCPDLAHFVLAPLRAVRRPLLVEETRVVRKGTFRVAATALLKMAAAIVLGTVLLALGNAELGRGALKRLAVWKLVLCHGGRPAC
eukprot:m.242510 g.242510  ORF g.242510 m.242510 type:complete len:329 (-) comp19008_c0_seq1:732-1718(-)